MYVVDLYFLYTTFDCQENMASWLIFNSIFSGEGLKPITSWSKIPGKNTNCLCLGSNAPLCQSIINSN